MNDFKYEVDCFHLYYDDSQINGKLDKHLTLIHKAYNCNLDNVPFRVLSLALEHRQLAKKWYGLNAKYYYNIESLFRNLLTIISNGYSVHYQDTLEVYIVSNSEDDMLMTNRQYPIYMGTQKISCSGSDLATKIFNYAMELYGPIKVKIVLNRMCIQLI